MQRYSKLGSCLIPGRRIRRGLGIIGMVLVAALLSGCVSVGRGGDPESLQYNLNSGYPVVGGSDWGHF